MKYEGIGLRLFILMVSWFLLGQAYASGDCKGQSCNGGDVDVTTDVTTGDVTVPVDVNTEVAGGDVNFKDKSRSLALVNTLGDVDIAGCLGSTQWATPLFSKQKLVVNWPCLAEFYLKNSKYELAAMAICNTEVVEEFETEEDCEAAHDFGPLEAEPVGEIIETFDNDQRLQDETIEVVQMAQASLEERVAKLEKKPAPRPRVIQAEPEPRYTYEQKMAVFEVLGIEEDDE